MSTILSPGSQVAGYGVEARLGEGATAVVYQVRHAARGTTHALKVLTTPSAALAARFDREIALLQRVRHPNVVRVDGVIDVGGGRGLLLERVRGPSLRDLLARHRLDDAALDAIARGIFAGVAAIHGAGLVHRDLKPGNILLAVEGDAVTAKVADFGLARLTEPDSDEDRARLTRTGLAMGTPSYMAPEQIRDAKRVGRRADIWALGCVLYEMASGRLPFEGRELVDLFARIVVGDRPRLEDVAPGLAR